MYHCASPLTQGKHGERIAGTPSEFCSVIEAFRDEAWTKSNGAKEEVLANLANFAYDPINYGFLRTLNVIDLFLDCLKESNDKFVLFATAGICNLALDKENKVYIMKNDGVNLVVNCLSSCNEETVLNAITTLMFLVTPISKPDITSLPIIDAMMRFRLSSNTRLANLASVFLEDYCSKAQIAEAHGAQTQWEEQEVEHTAQVPDAVQSTESTIIQPFSVDTG